jgi:hypothetical protein
MNEYQRYEFMTSRSAAHTRATRCGQYALRSHRGLVHPRARRISAGQLKHDPIQVLHEFFDGFLFWASWGAPQLALRFPHGILPVDLVDDYELDEAVIFTQHPDYDLLDIASANWKRPANGSSINWDR